MKRTTLLKIFYPVPLLLLFQNCSGDFKSAAARLDQSSVAEQTLCADGQTESGYLTGYALGPQTCGEPVIKTCVNGAWNRTETLVPSCEQFCRDRVSGQPQAVGTTDITFSLASAATQAACDAGRVTSTCDRTTGTFLPAPEANNSCLVVGQTCAYTAAAGRATPTGNLAGATVTGYALNAATYPTLCGAMVTRTCQSSGQWTGAVPVYTACQQSCLHPDNSAPVASGTAYGAYYTRNSGTQAECDAARVAAPASTCNATTGQFTPALPAVRYAACTVTIPPTTGTPLTSARVFISGHSLLDIPMGDNLMLLAASQGGSAKYNQQLVGGSSIKQRTRGNSPVPSTQFQGYSNGINRDYATGLQVINELRNPQTLGGDRYDTLLITERHDLMTSLLGESTVRHLRHYHERFIAGNAQGQTYFYESWLSHKREKYTEWIAYERRATKAWQCVVTRINHSLAAEGRPDRIKSVPAGTALAFLVERATQGNVAGITGANSLETLNRLFTDDVHPTRVAAYYMALVSYATIYRRSPVGAARPAEVSATQAASLQALAWEYIGNYLSTHVPPTMAECGPILRDACDAFWRFDWLYSNNPARIPSCQADVTNNNDYNPMYYNANTDSTFWLPAPQ